MQSTKVNIDGTVNILYAAVQNKIDRVVLACSSSTYGDSQNLPKQEDIIWESIKPICSNQICLSNYMLKYSKRLMD